MKQFFKPSLKKTITTEYNSDGLPIMSNSLNTVYKEIQNWVLIDCEYIIKLIEVIDDPKHDKLYVIMELCDMGQVAHWNEETATYQRNQNVFDFCSKQESLTDKLDEAV